VPEFYTIIKSIIYYLVFPVSICIELLSAGIFVLWFLSKKRLGNVLIISGLILLVLFSTYYFPSFMLQRLEYKYPPLTDSDISSKYSDIRYIVVLGGGIAYSERLPITSQLHPSSLVRIAEGVRLYYKLSKDSAMKLIVSGGGNYPVTSAELMARLSEEFGIKKEDIIIEKDSFTTYDEAINIKPVVKEERFFLVTSAGHMPRSMALFKNIGLHPIAVPTDHWVDEEKGHDWILPSADNLKKMELASYEYLGFIKEKLAGHM